jgi:acetamidase/formamidase
MKSRGKEFFESGNSSHDCSSSLALFTQESPVNDARYLRWLNPAYRRSRPISVNGKRPGDCLSVQTLHISQS